MVSVVNDNAFTNKDLMQQEHDNHENAKTEFPNDDFFTIQQQQQQQQLKELSRQSSDASDTMEKLHQERKKRRRSILDNTDNQSVNSIEQELVKQKLSNRQDSFDENTPLTSSTEGSVKSFKRYSSFEDEDSSSLQSTEKQDEQVSVNSFKKIASFATITKWWKKRVDDKISNQRNMEKTEERKMRFQLQYHFMTPFEKYKMGRKPWKLAIQILKIILVTTQVVTHSQIPLYNYRRTG